MVKNLKEYTLEELEEIAKALGEPSYRGKQMMGWLYKGIKSFEEMKNIPKTFTDKLMAEGYSIGSPAILRLQTSKLDDTKKVLFGLWDHQGVETVLMKYRYGNTVCISSQVGCNMGCEFCASAIGGKKRNLTPGEMVDQVVGMANLADGPITHIVVMGTGEPFDNYENLSKFLRIIHEPAGMGLGYRHITVSTVGLVDKIEMFGDDFPQVNLAISLHAPNDRIREKIMPINKKYGVNHLIQVGKDHIKKTSRRLTFEYALIEGLNDTDKEARELGSLLRGMLCHVNLIALNEVEESKYKGTPREGVESFRKILENAGIQVTIRRELGQDINAACGQLRLAEEGGCVYNCDNSRLGKSLLNE
ncbi:MAG: 23S rRNA (adenine(2503)-C(2))-methyltransferase RlmN [Anaerovoracaceae bacterium]|jgi:23S rRNA (adenine2503-C2)-methyltransferase|nr:23S rRNA (adenine(2503)-C(2))-methyltransferase RlmN [Anaerovoracaceae bacterium]